MGIFDMSRAGERGRGVKDVVCSVMQVPGGREAPSHSPADT